MNRTLERICKSSLITDNSQFLLKTAESTCSICTWHKTNKSSDLDGTNKKKRHSATATCRSFQKEKIGLRSWFNRWIVKPFIPKKCTISFCLTVVQKKKFGNIQNEKLIDHTCFEDNENGIRQDHHKHAESQNFCRCSKNPIILQK